MKLFHSPVPMQTESEFESVLNINNMKNTSCFINLFVPFKGKEKSVSAKVTHSYHWSL